MDARHLDCLAITETHLSLQDAHGLDGEAQQIGFRFLYPPKDTESCKGGAGFLVRCNSPDQPFSYEQLMDVRETTSPHVCWLRAKSRSGTKVYIASVYFPPSTKGNGTAIRLGILKALTESYSHLRLKGTVILAGDFNIHLKNLPNVVPTGVDRVGAPSTLTIERQSACTSTPSPWSKKVLQVLNLRGLAVVNGSADLVEVVNGTTVNPEAPITFKALTAVDYFFISADVMRRTSRVSVLPAEPKFAPDHSVISIQLELVPQKPLMNTSDKCPPDNAPVAKIQWRLPRGREAAPKWQVFSKRMAAYSKYLQKPRRPDLLYYDLTSAIMENLDGVFGRKPKGKHRDALRPRFNLRLRKLRDQVDKALRLKFAHPGSKKARLDYASAAKAFRIEAKAFRVSEARESRLRLQKLYTDDPLFYWKVLKKILSPSQKRYQIMKPAGMKWRAYLDSWASQFSNEDLVQGAESENGVPTADHPTVVDEPSEETVRTAEGLNVEITLKEVQAAIASVASQRAVGSDSIPNQALKHGGEVLHSALTLIFNECLEKGSVPREWNTALLVPVFKSGERSVPSNYRPIAILNSVSKLFTVVLNTRLQAFCDKLGLLAEEQAGFRKDRNCAQNLMILSESLFHRRLQQRRSYVAFIDLKKAYDSIDRSLLWQKLRGMGVVGRFLGILQALYVNLSYSVVLADAHTDQFSPSVGLRQGCNLSPLLFNLYINDLAVQLRAVPGILWERIGPNGYLAKGPREGSYDLGPGKSPSDAPFVLKVTSLFFADDIAIIASTPTGLQDALDIVAAYLETWRLRVNPAKSKVMIFKSRPLAGDPDVSFHIGADEIGLSEEYKYLGITLNPALDFRPTRKRFLGGAHAVANQIRALAHKFPLVSLAELWLSYHALSRSLLEYGQELMWKGWPEADRLTNKLTRAILCTSNVTRTVLINAELGAHSLEARRDWTVLRFWAQLLKKSDLSLAQPGQAFSVVGAILRASQEDYDACSGEPTYRNRANLVSTVHGLLAKYNLSRVDALAMSPREWKVAGLKAIAAAQTAELGLCTDEEAVTFRHFSTGKWLFGKPARYLADRDDGLSLLGRYEVTRFRIGGPERPSYVPLRTSTDPAARHFLGLPARPVASTESDPIVVCCACGSLDSKMHYVLECPQFAVLRDSLFLRLEVKVRELKGFSLSDPSVSQWTRYQVLLGEGMNSSVDFGVSFRSAVKSFMAECLSLRSRYNRGLCDSDDGGDQPARSPPDDDGFDFDFDGDLDLDSWDPALDLCEVL